MKIHRAITILTELSCPEVANHGPGDKAALKLGVEALRRVQRSRDKAFPIQGEELRGETKD